MTDTAILKAAESRTYHEAADALEQGATTDEYYQINHATPEMRDYLAHALCSIGGQARELFIRQWLDLLPRAEKARKAEACPVCGCFGRSAVGGYLECRVCRLAKPAVVSPGTGQGDVGDDREGKDANRG
jgi:hypothetical protein